MQKVIIIRYAEIHLKGKNRGYFERVFSVNLERALKGLRHELHRMSGRYLVACFDEDRTEDICDRISRVFGVHSYSVGLSTGTSMGSSLPPPKKSARRRAPSRWILTAPTRSTPRLPCSSMPRLGVPSRQEPRFEGGRPRPAAYRLPRHPRKRHRARLFGVRAGVGGMPVGTSGKGVLLISGGIDSPVAGYMMAKRGMSVELLHFHSYPYTNDGAKEKVKELARELARFSHSARLVTLNVAHIQEEIHAKCAPELNVTLLRRFMYRLAERHAKQIGGQCLITGESLGQVASQTIEGITSSNAVVTLPVLRPLIGFDKDEIISISRKIGTYETSVLPYEDCCTVFLPEFPAIKPKLSFVEEEENKLDVARLMDEAMASKEVFDLTE